MRVSVIVAHGLNGVMGAGGTLPWPRLAADMERFRRLTAGCPVVVGRKTFESPGFPLPGRPAVVLSRDLAYAPAGALAANDPSSALAAAFCLARAAGKGEVFVLGGAEVFGKLVWRAERVYRTTVNADFGGDATFPAEELCRGGWSRVKSFSAAKGPGNPFSQVFDTLDRPPDRRSQVLERLSSFFDSAEACRDCMQDKDHVGFDSPCLLITSDLEDIEQRIRAHGPDYFVEQKRRRDERDAKRAERDRVEAAARAEALAELREVLGSDEALATWLETPNAGFDNFRPKGERAEELARAASFLREGRAFGRADGEVKN